MSASSPRIALLPYEKRHVRRIADLALSELVWPDGVTPPQGTVADLGRDDHLIVFPSSSILYRPIFGVKCRLSLIIAEPFAIQARHYRLVRLMSWRFFMVLTHNRWLLDSLKNSRFLACADPWVRVSDPARIDKTRHMSLIASAKRTLEGHRLRHDIATWVQETNANVDLLGRAYQPLDDKTDGLLPYRFSVIVENVREPGYFSEKLLDCILCDTIPIYWGAPDIGEFFDTAGMIVCTSQTEIKAAIGRLSAADYPALLERARGNRARAIAHADHAQRAMQLVKEAASTRPS